MWRRDGSCSYPTFFFFFSFFFYLIVFIVTVQEFACSRSYGVNKTSQINANKQTKQKTIPLSSSACVTEARLNSGTKLHKKTRRKLRYISLSCYKLTQLRKNQKLASSGVAQTVAPQADANADTRVSMCGGRWGGGGTASRGEASGVRYGESVPSGGMPQGSQSLSPL